MSERHAQLLEQATAYMLANGVANLSLRRVAAALGTSARMLIYHFGSKEGLVIAVMNEVNSRFRAVYDSAFSNPWAEGQHPILPFWETLTSPANVGTVRLLYEVQILALQNPQTYGRYLEESTSGWLEAIERVLRPALKSLTTATLFRAVIDGLLLDVLSTGERRRATEALMSFLGLLDERAASLPLQSPATEPTGGEQ